MGEQSPEGIISRSSPLCGRHRKNHPAKQVYLFVTASTIKGSHTGQEMSANMTNQTITVAIDAIVWPPSDVTIRLKELWRTSLFCTEHLR